MLPSPWLEASTRFAPRALTCALRPVQWLRDEVEKRVAAGLPAKAEIAPLAPLIADWVRDNPLDSSQLSPRPAFARPVGLSPRQRRRVSRGSMLAAVGASSLPMLALVLGAAAVGVAIGRRSR